MGRRTLLLVAAVIVAALGTALVYLYAQNKQDTAAAATVPVRVLVATTTINSGTTGAAAVAASSFASRDVPSGSVVPGALTDASSVADLVAVSPIFPGQQIIPQQWGTSGATNNLPIPAGRMGMSIQLSDPQRVAGFVAPGSFVTVFATIPDPTAGGVNTTRVLLPKAQVIAVGPTTLIKAASSQDGSTNAEQIPAAILTLALTDKEAAKVAFATQAGSLYLGLLGKDTTVAPGPGVNATSLYR